MQSKIDLLAKKLWEFNEMHHVLKKSDCILVLGSNDIRVAKRGAELFLQGYAPLIAFSGKIGRLTEGLWGKPEAEVFAEVAIQMGIPGNKILVENNSTNTGENILFTKNLLEQHHIEANSFIIVQKPYLQKRAYAVFRKILPDKEVAITAPQIPYEEYPNHILTKNYIINIMVGDLQRLKIYPKKGYQIPMDIPEDVWQAYEELIQMGYAEHLVPMFSDN